MSNAATRTILGSQFIRATVLLLLLGGLAFIGGDPSSFGADDDDVLGVLFSDNSGNAGDMTDIYLRPNKEHPIYTFVDNPTRRAHKLKVKFLVGNPPVPLAESPLIQVAARDTKLVEFGKVQAPQSGMPPTFIDLDGPPYRFVVALEDENGKELRRQPTYVGLLRPSQYLYIPEISYDSEKGTLLIEVATLPAFSGPPCQVDLSSIANLDPGLARVSGSYRVTLQKGDAKPLVARDLHFLGSPPEKGLVLLRADGYDRAFVFETTFTRQDTPVTPLRVGGKYPRLRLNCPLYSAPDPNPKFAVTLELDNVARSDVILELGWDAGETGSYDTKLFFPPGGDRYQHVGVNAKNQYGALLFATQVKDWSWPIDLSTAGRKMKLRGRLLDLNHKLLEIEGDKEQPTTEIFQTVTIDKTPPQSCKLLGIPDKLVRGDNLTLQIKAEDPESGIESVKVYFKSPPADEKIVPKELEAALPPHDETGNGIWTANISVPVDGPTTPLSVRAVNRAGLAQWYTWTIPLVDKGSVEAAKAPKTGTIKGKVTDADDRPQPDQTVTATNVKTMDKLEPVMTKQKGEFTFENVPPGTYELSCINQARGGIKDTVIKEVKAGEIAEVSMTLKFR